MRLPDATTLLPRATYRLQLDARFGLHEAAALVPQLARLGVSHVYLSPCLQAAPGSTHGYDVVDPGQLDRERGGEGGFRRLVAALREHGLGLLLDIVPNHMAASPANRWWWDVLERGPASPHAACFDIDWEQDDGPRVLLPVLGERYDRVLESGALRVRRDGAGLSLECGELRLPLSSRSVRSLRVAAAGRRSVAAALGSVEPAPGAEEDALDAEIAELNADADRLDALLAGQHYRLASWRRANEDLNWRRFFNVSSLVGLRTEDERVFRDSHRLVLELVRAGDVQGLRVDHVDGLRDPAGYLERLAVASGGAWTVVEKILVPGERLPRWPVAGTTGYDFLARVTELFTDPRGEAPLTRCYENFTGVRQSWDEVVRASKRQVLEEDFGAELDRLARWLAAACRRHRSACDHGRREQRTALAELLVAFPVYRSYAQPGREPGEQDRGVVAAAVRAAREQRPDLDAQLFAFLGELVLQQHAGEAETEFGLRFAQLSGPLMAKGVEDTAFHRYHRLLSLNEVGCDPGRFGRPLAEFHGAMALAAREAPLGLLTLGTHDTKRSADVRARIGLLAEIPEAWAEAVERLAAIADSHREDAAFDLDLEFFLHQTLVGAWPLDPGRVAACLVKAAREGRVASSWLAPRKDFEAALEDFVHSLLGDRAFRAELRNFLDAERLVERGRLTSLAQTALLLTCPGVPDLYQGTELWSESLVDPDNRRPVDHTRSAAWLATLATLGPQPPVPLAADQAGLCKLWLIARLLGERRAAPELWDGGYEPLASEGEQAERVVAFTRGRLLTVVPRLVCGLAGGWGDTAVSLPRGRWTNLLGGERHAGGKLALSELLARFPVAVLRDEAA